MDSLSEKMIIQSPDTHPDIEKIQIALLRQAGVGRRISRTGSLSQTTINLSRRAILCAKPEFTEKALQSAFIAYHYGQQLSDITLKTEGIMKNPDLLAAVRPVVDAFEKLGILYYIGGSIASSAYGMARATLNVDMVSDLKKQHIRPLVEMLKSSYYIDGDMIADAVSRRASFNLIHLETMLKIDVFIIKQGAYHEQAFKRRKKDTLDEDQQDVEFYLVSPEDIILAKLEWYRLGGGVSDRQWHDVLGVLKVQENLLDRDYLAHWAGQLKLMDLLEKAFQGAGM